MNKKDQELIDWFNNYFDNCYYVKHDDHPKSIFMVYDKNYIRQKKLAKLEGKELIKTDITGVCLFGQDLEYKWFMCNYNIIWSYLRDNYSYKYNDIRSFIKDRLDEHTKMIVTQLTPIESLRGLSHLLEGYTKMSFLTSGDVNKKINNEI